MPAYDERVIREYNRLWESLQIKPDKLNKVQALALSLEANKQRYLAVSTQTGVPWYVIGLIHLRECSSRFDRHLHNGDPLTARTKRVPPNRPEKGKPPFTWEESALDAIRLLNLHQWHDWSISGIAYVLERYNGFGYRRRSISIKSPYLWSWSNHYTRGKFDRDSHYNENMVDAQPGCMVILYHMAFTKLIPLQAQGHPCFIYNPAVKHHRIELLQEFLNSNCNAGLKVDGYAGRGTSEAVMKAFGNYMIGDPRGAK